MEAWRRWWRRRGAGGPACADSAAAVLAQRSGHRVKVISSYNKTVTADGKNIVALGIVMQGSAPSWPGMMLPSVGNPTVTINHIAINVVNDQSTIFPSGGVGTFTQSGQ